MDSAALFDRFLHGCTTNRLFRLKTNNVPIWLASFKVKVQRTAGEGRSSTSEFWKVKSVAFENAV